MNNYQITKLPNLNVGFIDPQNTLVGPIWRCCGQKTRPPGHFWVPFQPNLVFAVFYKGKMAQNWPKMSKFQNPLNTHPKMVNACNKCQTYHFGGCFAGFPGSVLRSGRSKSHFLSLEKGHFRQKCPLLGTKKWDFERPNLRTDSGNPAKHPQNGGF